MSENKINVAIVGVGNLSSALLQSIEFYDNNNSDSLLYPSIGGYRIPDIKVVAAYDVDARKVGKDVSDAIFSPPNNMHRLVDVLKIGVVVEKLETFDGIADYARPAIQIDDTQGVDLTESLKQSGAEILVINVPSGADRLVTYCAESALSAGIAVINSTPSPMVRDTQMVRQFKERGIPIIGDDLQSRTGGTIFHKGLLEVLNQQGVKLIDTYQLDVSGGLEGLTTLDYERRAMKRNVKEDSIRRTLPYKVNVASGTTDYLDFLGSTRLGHYWVHGKGFLGHDIRIDIRMETDDGASGAASLVDAIRALKLALGRGHGGPVKTICSNLFKTPPEYYARGDAIRAFDEFISGERES